MIVAAVLGVLYLAFVVWYGGHGTPMTQPEIDALFAKIAERAKNEPNPDGHLRDDLETLAASDDGNEFFMLNLIRYRAKATYPAGPEYAAYGDDPLEADARYARAIMPYLLRHGGLPVFLGEGEGRFLDEPGDTEWQRVVLVRYRSRRDMLEMVADLAGQSVGVHKWASIEKTQVFPVRPILSFVFVRGLVATVFIALGLALHFVVRSRGRG
jgi:hypothetical protein